MFELTKQYKYEFNRKKLNKKRKKIICVGNVMSNSSSIMSSWHCEKKKIMWIFIRLKKKNHYTEV